MSWSVSLKRLCHWGPISVLGIIKLITWSMVHILGMYWPPHGSLGGAINASIFLMLAAATLYYFLQSLLEGPGYVPLGWKPEMDEDKEYLQFCTVCKGYKAPRSHHCKKCGRCVLKMDHHCPWINSCVGHLNHGYFTSFLLCAVLGCAHASVVLSLAMYRALTYVRVTWSGPLAPRVTLTLSSLLGTLLALGMSVGVVLAVSALFYLQIRGILRNRTTIEDWIVEKAVCRRSEHKLPRFQFPYDRGWRQNWAQVFSVRGNGLSWTLREGCGPYDLTMEQKAQKSAKLERSRLYTCTADYDGRRFWSVRACLDAPCDVRVALLRGDTVRVTRQRTHWLFGQKLSGDEERGWFPRGVATPTDLLDPTKQD